MTAMFVGRIAPRWKSKMLRSGRRGKLAYVLLVVGVGCLAFVIALWFGIRGRVADVVTGIGESRFKHGDIDGAMAHYDWAIRIDPNVAMAWNDRGLGWDLKGEYDKALADLNEAIRLNPQGAKAFNNRGYTWLQKGDRDKALADLDEAIRLDPRQALAFNNRGLAWFGKGDLTKAINDFDESIRLDPAPALTHNNRGMAKLSTGQYSEAIADLDQALRLDPNSVEACNNLAWLQATCSDSRYRNGKAAVLHATKACELSAWSHSNHLSTLAAAYAEAGDFVSAVKWMEKSIAVSPPVLRGRLKSVLELFKAQQPYREDGRKSAPVMTKPSGNHIRF
jgi:tetratricopeptide (TPR) repeat protein